MDINEIESINDVGERLDPKAVLAMIFLTLAVWGVIIVGVYYLIKLFL